MAEVEVILSRVADRAAINALIQVDVTDSDLTEQVHELAIEWGRDHAAELVGKRILDNGDIIDNPDIEWSIDESTRADIADLITQAEEEGWSNEMLASEIEDRTAFSQARSEMIARTELRFSDVQGNLIGWKKSGVVEYKQFLLSDDHLELDECDDNSDLGPIPFDDEFPGGDPPIHPHCLIPDTKISAFGVSAYFKRWFDGEVIVIRTSRNSLTVTINHPILTQRGWIPAGLLNLDDCVYECADPFSAIRLINPDDYQIPAVIEQIFDSFKMSPQMSSISVPSSTEAFHGDGMANGEINIIGSNSLLPYRVKSYFFDQIIDNKLGRSHGNIGPLDPYGTSAQLLKSCLSSPDSIMSGHGPINSLFSRKPTHGESSHFTERSNGKSVLLESVPDSNTVTTNALCNIYRGLTGLISEVKIVDLIRRNYSGHVYNLSTKDGWYFAESIITHNCECSLVGFSGDAVNEGDVEGAFAVLEEAEKLEKGFIDDLAHQAATSPRNDLPLPSKEQIHSGNYKKGHLSISGIKIAIENPSGSSRRPEWPPLRAHYGYVEGVEGADGDHVDVFIQPDTTDDYSGNVYVINQRTRAGDFDEHKVMLGYPTELEAFLGYLANYHPEWDGVDSIIQMTVDEFKNWLYDGKSKTVPATSQAEAITKWAEDTDRDESGKWTSGGGGSSAVADRLVKEIHEHGGFTFDARTKQGVEDGYAVGVFPEHSLTFDNKYAVTKEGIQNWLSSNEAKVNDSKVKIGGWIDDKTGKVWLDLVRVYNAGDKDLAISMGKKFNQIAIADLGEIRKGNWKRAFINTGGTGEKIKKIAKGSSGVRWILFDNDATAEDILKAIMGE